MTTPYTYLAWTRVMDICESCAADAESLECARWMRTEHPAVHRRYQNRRNKAASRVRRAAQLGPCRSITIELSLSDFALVSVMRDAANDGEDFYRRALLTGAKFRANIGAGKTKPGKS